MKRVRDMITIYSHNYFNNLDVSKGTNPLWKTFKLFFTNKHSKGNTSIILIEKIN